MLTLPRPWLLVAAEGASPDITNYLLQYGVLGLVVIGLLAGRFLVPAWVYATMREERDAARAELAALRAKYEESSTRQTAALTTAVEELTRAAATGAAPPKGPRR